MIFWWNFQNTTFSTRGYGKTFLLSLCISFIFGYFNERSWKIRELEIFISFYPSTEITGFPFNRLRTAGPQRRSKTWHPTEFLLFLLSPLPSPPFCDINDDYSALNGKIACLRSQERTGHRLKACLDRVACSPGSGPWEGDGMPRRYRGQKCVHDICTNAGGTAEGLPFVPMGGRGAFFFSAATGTGKSITS